MPCAPYGRLQGLSFSGELDTFRPAERQFAALLDIAADSAGCVSVAVSDGVVQGYASFHPPTEPEVWSLDRTGKLIELGAIEVAPAVRGLRVAEQLLERSLSGGRFDDTIVFATIYVWHFDVTRTGLGDLGYRRLLERLYRGAGFELKATSDPEIRASPANALMARIGRNTPEEVRAEFDRLRLQAHRLTLT